MIKFYEIKDYADLKARFNFFDGPQLEYWLKELNFPAPFYLVGITHFVGTPYDKHKFLLSWLVENDDCRGAYMFDHANGFFMFKHKEDALLFRLTFAEVTFE